MGPEWSERDWRTLLLWVRRKTRNQSDAEDLLQSAFIRLAEYTRHGEVKNHAAFILCAARNLATDEYRHRRVRNEREDGLDGLLQACDDAPLQSEVLESRERLRRVAAGLDQLGPRTREVFLMHHLDGLKYREIAQTLGISVSAVEKHIARAALFLASWVEGW